MPTIAIVSMGEMGSGIAQRLVERGARVLTSLEGRSAASIDRARQAGVEALSDAAMISQADMLLSIVPPASARAISERYLPVIEHSANKPTFLDCNAIAPQTLHDMAAPFVRRALSFGDASIIGFAPRPDGYSPRVYMSGPTEREALSLKALGIETQVLSASLGDASALKMAYAGVTKGIQAIGASMALGAARAGAAEAFVAELEDTQPTIYAWLCKTLPAMFAKAHRWDDEMQEIAKFLEPERGASEMLSGAARLYRHVAEHNRIGANSEIICTLGRFAKCRN